MKARRRPLLKSHRMALSARLLVCSLLAWGVLGCGKGTSGGSSKPASKPTLVLLGVDGFDWKIIDPLIREGRMPVLEKLLKSGTRADLLTLVPLEKSPVIWTTIATGRLPSEEERGRGFLVEGAGETPQAYASWSRNTRAFWNILSERERSVSVLGWLETWPAEQIRGTIVTDYVQYDVAEREKLRRTTHRTFPDSVEAEIAPFIVRPKDLALARLLPFLGAEFDSMQTNEALYLALDALRWIYAGDLTFTAIARHMLRTRTDEVFGIYLRGPDAVCHKLWEFRENAAKGEGDPELNRLLGPTIDLYYEETDRLIGEILEEIDLRHTNLLLVSDHGFQGPRISMDGSPMLGIYMHREIGTMLLVGPAAAGPGVHASGARVQDVLPTALHLLGLPVAEDLDGEVALDLLGKAGGREREVAKIETYETSPLVRFAADVSDSAASEEIAERVKSLGYVR